MKRFIANASYAEEADLKKMLTQFGQVAWSICRCTRRREQEGFGFIEMPLNAQEKEAIAALYGKEITGGRSR
jgi:hypothetical protein